MSAPATPAAALECAAAALAGTSAWEVGGAVRDRILGRATDDVDIVVDGDPEPAARLIASAARAHVFELSEGHGAWRVVDRDHRWQIDVSALRAGTLAGDLALRDFTINALARPLAGGDIEDPTGGLADLEIAVLRAAGPTSMADDPLRVMRLARVAVELGFTPEDATVTQARAAAAGLTSVAAERVYAELCRIVRSPAPGRGLDLMAHTRATPVVLPELDALRGVRQNRFHHLDVHDHTRAVLDAVVALQEDPAAHAGAGNADAVRALLQEPLADGLTRGDALRLGALLHDIAKPATRASTLGRVTFMGHDRRGSEMVTEILGRLRAAERVVTHVASLARHHLRLGFLVRERPLAPRAVYGYLTRCGPVAADVTLLSIADRLATRGDNAGRAIAAHLELAREMLAAALRWRSQGSPEPLIRGNDLARELGLTPGPELGVLLEELAAARYAGEITDRATAVAHARAFRASS